MVSLISRSDVRSQVWPKTKVQEASHPEFLTAAECAYAYENTLERKADQSSLDSTQSEALRRISRRLGHLGSHRPTPASLLDDSEAEEVPEQYLRAKRSPR